MRKLLKTHQMVGLLLLSAFVLTTASGCATPHVEVPIAVECPRPAKISPDLLRPTPTQYLLPPELRRTAPKQP